MHLKYLGYGKVKHKSAFLLNAAAETKEIHDPFCFACTLGLLPCLCRCKKC